MITFSHKYLGVLYVKSKLQHSALPNDLQASDVQCLSFSKLYSGGDCTSYLIGPYLNDEIAF